jgi:YVTN family beta-propeller protein
MLHILQKRNVGNRGLALLLALAMAFTVFAVVPTTAKADTVSTTITVGILPVSVAINPVTNKIYVGNYGGNNVTVIDGATNKTTTIPNVHSPFSIAVNTETDRIYVANDANNSVTVIDGATNEPTTIAVPRPFSIAINPATNKIYVSNIIADTVTVIDGATNSVAATISVGVSPKAIAVNPVTNRIYVANYDGNTVSVIDGSVDSVIATVPTGMRPCSVAVNPVLNRIYVANSTSDNVTVIDGKDNSVLATVTAGSSPFAIVVNPLSGKAYTANMGDNSVTVIDGATNSVAATVTVGTRPQSIAVNPAANKIYTANSASTTVTVIDGSTDTVAGLPLAAVSSPVAVAVNPVTGKVYAANNNSRYVTVIDGDTNATATVPVGGYPETAEVNPATGKVYVADKSNGKVTVIDGDTNGIASTILAVGDPQDIAINPVTNRIYTANYGYKNVTVIDGATNSVVATVTLPQDGYPQVVAVNPATNRIYVAYDGSADVTVIDGATNSVAATIPAGNGPQAIGINTATNRIYVVNYFSKNVTVINGATNAVAATVPTGTSMCPYGVAVNPVTNKIYVSDTSGDNVTVIDGATNAVAATVPVGDAPYGVAVNPDTNKIYVANVTSGDVTVIDGGKNTVIATVPAGDRPGSLAVDAATNKIYAANYGSKNVTVIDGASDTATATLAAGSNLFGGLAADPAKHKVYIPNKSDNKVTVIGEQNEQTSNLITQISTLTKNATSDTTPDFEFTASYIISDPLPVLQIWYQVDTLTGPWHKASRAGSSAGATLPALARGTHILYAFATDGMEATSINSYPANGSVPGAVSAYAFTVVDYRVNALANNAAYGTATCSGTFDPGSTATLHAAANTGYHFVRWLENGAQVSTNADYTITVSSMRTLTAEFAINNYTVNASANNAAYGTVTGGGAFDHGSTVTLHAAANGGYRFVSWTEGGAEVSTSADYTFTVKKDRTLTAEFADKNCTVNASANNAAYGTVTGGGTYELGTSITLHAAANSGYRFVRWTEGGAEVSKNADYTFTVEKNTTLTAEFAENIPDAIPVTITCKKTDVANYGAATGTITVTAAGGNSGSYLYSIDGGVKWQASGSFGNLAAGKYSAKACDANNTANASAAVEITVAQPKLAWTGAANKMPAKAYVGRAWFIKPVSVPKGYTQKSVDYASSNKKIVYIDKKGNATFKKSGSVKITVTTVFKKGKKTKTVKTVKKVAVKQLAVSITLSKTTAVLAVKKTLELTVKFTPASATDKTVKWKSSNTKVATVSAKGVVTAKKKGTAVITCTAQDGSKAKAACKVTVK